MRIKNLYNNILDKMKLKKTEFFLIRRFNSSATGKSDIMGITDDEEYAKSMQSVFCDYEKVKFFIKEAIK